jgi:hypothetical protein
MNDKTNYKKIRTEKSLLAYCGVSRTGRVYGSPLHKDSNPSFSIFMGRNDGVYLFKDFAENKSGDIINLHMLLRKCDFGTACRFLADWDGASPIIQLTTTHRGNSQSINNYRSSIQNALPDLPPQHAKYIIENRLVLPDWVADGLSAKSDEQGVLYYKMVNEFWHCRQVGEIKARNLGAGAYSRFGTTGSTTMYVFEGIGDALAWIDAWNTGSKNLYIVLNSSSNASLAITDFMEYSGTVNLCLDNDRAGDDATNAFKNAFGSRAVDYREQYRNYKDFREAYNAFKGIGKG